MGVSCVCRAAAGNRQRVAQQQPGGAAQGSVQQMWCGVYFLSVLLAAAGFIFSSCRFNNNRISLSSVFFLAQSLTTLEHIKTVSLRYGQEYFFYILLLFKTSSCGFLGMIQELVLPNSLLMMFFSGYSLGHPQVVHLTFWERVR